MRQRLQSKDLFERTSQVIPGGANSPVRAFLGVGQPPLIVDYGVGDTVYDVDGHEYIDYCCSWGALIHGHAHPAILRAVQKRMEKGTSFGITCSVEEELARKVVSLVDSIDSVRFVSSGTEATMSAVRLARGFTGRPLVVKFSGNYHGHADFFLAQAGSGVAQYCSAASSAGVPEDIVQHTLSLPYNDVEAVSELFQDREYRSKIAAVILEPIAGNMGVVPARQEFVQMLREETEKAGALLIFDEVITGFRVALGGAQSLYGVKPDLTCLGKILGGGFPAAAFGGRKDVMAALAPQGPVYQAGTLSGNPVAMEAGLQALKLLEQDGTYEELERKTTLLTDPIAEYLKEKKIKACLQRVGSMFTIFFGRSQVNSMEEAQQLDPSLFSRFFREMFERGVYLPPSQYEAWFVSTVHQDAHLEKTRDAILDFLKRT